MQQPQQPGKILRWERLRQLATKKVRETSAAAEQIRYWAGVKEGLEWLLIEMMSMPDEDLSAPASLVTDWKLEYDILLKERDEIRLNLHDLKKKLAAPASPVEEIPKEFNNYIEDIISKRAEGGMSTENFKLAAQCGYEFAISELTESKPSPVIEIGEQTQAYRNAIVSLNARIDEMWNHRGISNAIPDSYIKAINKEQQNCQKVLNDYAASHPAPAPIVGERTDKPLEGQMLGVLNKTSDRLFQRTAPTEQALPEGVDEADYYAISKLNDWHVKQLRECQTELRAAKALIKEKQQWIDSHL